MNPVDSENSENGHDMPDASANIDEDAQTDNGGTDAEWEQRTLCRDESCIGVVGPDGRCKECGLIYAEGDPKPADATGEKALEEVDPPKEAPEEFDAHAESSDDDMAWENRVLCSNESCIGVIGPDGRCKECGKPYKAE